MKKYITDLEFFTCPESKILVRAIERVLISCPECAFQSLTF